MKRALMLAVVIASFILAGRVAMAHEFVVKPEKSRVKAGETVKFGVHSAHVFIESEELEDPATVKVFILDGVAPAEVAVKTNEAAKTFDGQAVFKNPGTKMLDGRRLQQVWSLTPEGMKKGSKKELPGATKSNRYEKFAKTLIVVEAPDEGYKKVLGHKLEIVPVDDPSKAKIGEDLTFQVLYDGKPLSTAVWATYDGFTKNPNSYAYFTEADDKGLAKVKITAPGLWMVRVENKAAAGGDIDQEVIRSVLVFEVK